MRTHAKGRLRAAPSAVVSALTMALLLTSGCSTKSALPESQEAAPDGATSFDPSSLAWDPSALEARLPAIVGWREASDGGRGQVVVLSEEASPVVAWEAPAGLACRAVALDPASRTLALTVSIIDGQAPREMTYLCHPDTRPKEVRLPDGYDTLTSLAFLPDGSALALATFYGPESIDATAGIVLADGSWSPVTLTGKLPEHQYVEDMFSIPGTDAFAIVLKTAGTPADRDDEALVLARHERGALVSFTPPYMEDSLPNAVPLQARQGVAFVRSWRIDQRGQVVPELVEARFAGNAWTERVLVSDHGITAGIESGTVAVSLPNDGMLVRSAAPQGDVQRSQLLRVQRDGTLVPTGMDVTGTTHLLWMSK